MSSTYSKQSNTQVAQAATSKPSAPNRRTLRQQAMQNIHQISPFQFAGSRRIYLDAGETIQVPCRAVTLTDPQQSEILLLIEEISDLVIISPPQTWHTF